MLGWEVTDTVRVYTNTEGFEKGWKGYWGWGVISYTRRTATTAAELLRGGGVVGSLGGGGGDRPHLFSKLGKCATIQ